MFDSLFHFGCCGGLEVSERKLNAYFEKLNRLSSEELTCSLEKVAALERRNVAAFIAHLVEIYERKLHLELGYSGLFNYCVERFRLSEGSAGSRCRVAEVARRLPQVLDALAAGKISLTVASLLARELTEENVERVLADSEGMTKKQAEDYRAALSPKEPVSPGIRQRPERRSSVREHPPQTPEAPATTDTKAPPPPPLTLAAATTAASEKKGRPARVEPANSEIYNFRFAANKRFKKKLHRLAEVLGIPNPERNMAKILETALDMGLEKKDPQKKLERRKKRKARNNAQRQSTSPEKLVAQKDDRTELAKPAEKKRSRYISPCDKEAVLEQASYQCEYRSPEGVRCSCRTGLEIDHVKPWGKLGSNDPANLRVLCKAHNLYLAEREYGREFVEARIEAKRLQSQASAIQGAVALGGGSST